MMKEPVLFCLQGHVRVCGQEVPLLVVGDGAYPLRPYLTKGFQGPVNAAQKKYNIRLSKARVVVEQAFGRLKCRWRRVLKRSEHYAPERPPSSSWLQPSSTPGGGGLNILDLDLDLDLVERTGEPVNRAWVAAVQEAGRSGAPACRPTGRSPLGLATRQRNTTAAVPARVGLGCSVGGHRGVAHAPYYEQGRTQDFLNIFFCIVASRVRNRDATFRKMTNQNQTIDDWCYQNFRTLLQTEIFNSKHLASPPDSMICQCSFLCFLGLSSLALTMFL